MPVADTVSVAVWPAVIVWPTGCTIMDGATGAAVMASAAALLVAIPAVLLTLTLNEAPLSAIVVTGVVYAGKFAPLIGVPFFVH